jgi:hypothetical protein
LIDERLINSRKNEFELSMMNVMGLILRDRKGKIYYAFNIVKGVAAEGKEKLSKCESQNPK